jgi:exopolysaccharide production protein ExoZ
VARVCGVHFGTLSAPWRSVGWDRMALCISHNIGNAGVDLFFALGSYRVYGHLMRRPPPFVACMARRIQRTYLAFLAVFVLYLLLAWRLSGAGKLPDDGSLGVYLPSNLLLLPALFPPEPLITMAWSLSYEMCFYLILPMITAVLALRRRGPGVRMVALAAVTAAALLAFGTWAGRSVCASFCSARCWTDAHALGGRPAAGSVRWRACWRWA